MVDKPKRERPAYQPGATLAVRELLAKEPNISKERAIALLPGFNPMTVGSIVYKEQHKRKSPLPERPPATDMFRYATKREWYANSAMQGLLANPVQTTAGSGKINVKSLIEAAFGIADAMEERSRRK